MADPCGAPAYISIVSDSVSLHLTLAFLLSRKFEIHLTSIIGKLSVVNFSLRPSCHMVSKAFWTSRAGMAIGSKLLSEQPARDRVEHGAVSYAVRLKSVLVRVNTEQLHIYNYYFTSAVCKLWYASV